MKIAKSSRNSKIVGNYGEHLVCHWLSRSGFEVAVVDHTGMDIVAYNKAFDQRLGISVKSRCRLRGKEAEAVIVMDRKEREALMAGCDAFKCEPWLAIYVECEHEADLFVVSLDNFEKNYKAGESSPSWRMNAVQKSRYAEDAEVRHIHFNFSSQGDHWWGAGT